MPSGALSSLAGASQHKAPNIHEHAAPPCPALLCAPQELFAALAGGWRIDAAYTRLDAPQRRSVILGGRFVTFDGQAVRRARDIASANLTWAPGAAPFSATLTVRYNGGQNDLAFTDPSFTPVLVSLRAFTLVNLGGSWKLNDRAELYGRVENLFDQRYQEVFSFAGAGRAAYGGVRVRF